MQSEETTLITCTAIIKIDNTQITRNEKAGRAIRSTSNQSSEPCEVAQYPQQKRRH